MHAHIWHTNRTVGGCDTFVHFAPQFNCRKVSDEPDVLEGVAEHPLFLGIVAAEALLQVVIIEAGGAAFQTVPLSASQWGMCTGIGATTLLVRRLLVGINMDGDGGSGGNATLPVPTRAAVATTSVGRA
eukprot:106923-Chlamydomonas_euryale.AAC.3